VDEGLLEGQLAYYRAHAGEYDEWFLRGTSRPRSRVESQVVLRAGASAQGTRRVFYDHVNLEARLTRMGRRFSVCTTENSLLYGYGWPDG
jgi:hypothetical protein